MDLTTVVTIFLRQTVREQRIPFEIKRELPNPETIAALSGISGDEDQPSKL